MVCDDWNELSVTPMTLSVTSSTEQSRSDGTTGKRREEVKPTRDLDSVGFGLLGFCPGLVIYFQVLLSWPWPVL